MTTIAVIVFLTLAVIAAIHVAWGFGARWPVRDERDLVALVIGQTGRLRMPALGECLVAAAAIFLSGVVALALAGLVRVPGPSYLVTATGALVTAVFAGRGLAAYLPAWRRRFSQEPFAMMDKSWYAPLCLLMAVAFALMSIKHGVT